MKHYPGFIITHQTFAERIGLPDEFSAAVGRVTLSFSDLESALSDSIEKLLKLDFTTAQIITAELSFKNKVHLFASLVRNMSSTHKFNTGNAPVSEVLDELVACLFRAEQLRNQVFHSSYSRPDLSDSVKRQKITAKATKGFQIQEQSVDSSYILDVADFIGEMATSLIEFLWGFGE